MVTIGMRALGMWQHLFAAAANNAPEPTTQPRGVVTADDAAAALFHAAVTVDAALQEQNGQLTTEQRCISCRCCSLPAIRPAAP